MHYIFYKDIYCQSDIKLFWLNQDTYKYVPQWKITSFFNHKTQ